MTGPAADTAEAETNGQFVGEDTPLHLRPLRLDDPPGRVRPDTDEAAQGVPPLEVVPLPARGLLARHRVPLVRPRPLQPTGPGV